MTARKSPLYNPEFPEAFPWDSIDSITMNKIANEIVYRIDKDFKNDRKLIPGLRAALNIMAEIADL